MPQIEIAVDLVHKTPGAVLVSNGNKKEWIPLAAITDYTDEIEIGESITIFISEKLAYDKGLI
jgi:hypothetical protein